MIKRARSAATQIIKITSTIQTTLRAMGRFGRRFRILFLARLPSISTTSIPTSGHMIGTRFHLEVSMMRTRIRKASTPGHSLTWTCNQDVTSTIRSKIAVQEISAVVFPANDLATVDTVKSRGIYNTMLNSPDWKDFSTNYQQRQVDDWANDDFYDLTSALQASITDCFGAGMDPMAALESDVIPGFLAALRAYVQEGVSLGYSTAPSSAADVYMMSMASAGQEGKAGYLSASNHAVLKEASMNIMKHARAVAKVSDALEASRRNALQGYPIARSTSSAAMTYFEQKEAEEEQHSVLKRLADELEISNNMRELRKLSVEMGELQLKRG